jgi:hypothetical protein
MRTQPKGEGKQCCIADEGGPLGVGLQGQAPNHLELRWSKARVVSVEEKARGTRQVGTGKTNESKPLMMGRKALRWHRNRALVISPGRARREPAYRPRGVRPEGGVSPVRAAMWNVGTCWPMPREKLQAGDPRERESTDAASRGGAVRSSDEARESGSSEGAALSCYAGGSTSNGRSPWV